MFKYLLRLVTLSFIFLTVAFYQESAQALVEARLHYHLQSIDTDVIRPSGPSLSNLTGIGVDVIASPPIIPLAFGLRYEWLGGKKSHQTNSDRVEADINRLSALVSYRLIDSLILLGLIGTFGIHEEGTTVVTTRGGSPQKFKGDIKNSYSIGVEGGVKLLSYSLGAELGFSKLVDKGVRPNQKYQGAYAKVFLGFGF